VECSSCQRVNPGGSRFCSGCGSALARACGACGQELPPDAGFCNACGQPVDAGAQSLRTTGLPERTPRDYTPKHLAVKILQSKSALEGERKQVTVLFADVRGSMQLSEQIGPERWHDILDGFFRILAEGVHRFEGTVNQYTGDGIMALFGAPIAHEDHAQRACYAALHLCDALRSHAQQLRREHGLVLATRIGLNSGEVVVGKIGDDLRMDYTAQGHTVGLAERMQQLAEDGKPYLGEATEVLVRGFFRLEALGGFDVKGVSAPVSVFGLEGLGELRSRLDRSRARGFSKFVGRGKEIDRLEVALERALEGNGQVVGVVGDAGIGKSRLCHEFVARCRARGITVRHATGVSHGQSIPLLPILEFLRESFGVSARDDDRTARQKIAGGIFLVDAELQSELPLLFDFLGVPDPDRPAPVLEPALRQRRVLELVKCISVARSQREPAVLLFEDLHWLDPTTETFVTALADATEGNRTLMVVNFRPEYHADWTHRSYFEQLALRPLDADRIQEMLTEWLGGDPSLDGLAERLAQRTAGNPFFVEEVVLALIEAGRLTGGRGDYQLAGLPSQIEIPDSVHSVLAARIDRLAERDKQVLQSAAVIGIELPDALLTRVVDLPAAELSEALRSLVRTEFLYERSLYPELEYAFKHPLTQEVAAATQLRERRARTHGAVAKALEAHHAGALDENAAHIAHHWEQAAEPLEAARWSDRAADWIGLGVPSEALTHVRRVRALLADVPDSPEVLELRLRALGWIALHETRLGPGEGELDALVDEGHAVLSRLGDRRDLELSFRMTIAMAYMLAGRTADGILYAEETASRFDGLEGIESARGMLVSLLGITEAVDRALALRDESAVPLDTEIDFLAELPVGPMALGLRGRLFAAAGQLGRAGHYLDRAFELATACEESSQQGVTQGDRATLERQRGATATAVIYGRQAVELAEQVASPTGLRQALCNLGQALLANGELGAARATLERGLATGRGRYFSVPLLSALAETLARQGEHSRAQETAREALAVASATGQAECHAQITLARVLRLGSDLEAEEPIRAALARAEQLVEELGPRVYRPEICEERAALARLHGNEAECTRELREALRLYTGMAATGHVERLTRELGE